MTRRNTFPTFAVFILLFGVVWLLKELGVWAINVPWLPVLVIIISLGWIFNRFN